MKRLLGIAALLLLAGCGGGGTTRISPDHATLTGIHVLRDAVEFTFDVKPDETRSGYVPREQLSECGSGAPVRPNGAAFLVVHFLPAQTQGVPKRIVMPSGTVLDVWKVCDFEADVAWAIGVSRQSKWDVSSDGATVTVTFE